ncbi:hypothetical protein [Halalkalibacter urbisdiaboli]|uniref:hypothetical protein n=1 Tax=Halalkalibacter urbisdiaboli TaxID=1960589 RepID=UPI000B44D587|nr:hypothetical protein [Halalkalibacter urbisdiaboli]
MRFLLLVTLSFLLFVIPINSVFADNSEKILVHPTGIQDYTLTEANNEHHKITRGKAVKGKFSVDKETFEAEITDQSKNSYSLKGQIVDKNDDLDVLIYEGIDSQDKLKTFTAILMKEPKNKNRYSATVTIETYENEDYEELLNGVTYHFDNSSPVVKLQSIGNKNSLKDPSATNEDFNDGNIEEPMMSISSSTDYWEWVGVNRTDGIQTGVSSESTIKRGDAPWISIRSTTDTGHVEDEWEDHWYYSVKSGTSKVVNYTSRLWTNEAASFRNLDPKSGSKRVPLPFYFGQWLGVQQIPIVVSQVSTNGNYTSDLTYDFSWSSTVAYKDDADVLWNKSEKSYVTFIEMNTNYNNIGTGDKYLHSRTEFNYSTQVTANYNTYTVYSQKANYFNFPIKVEN